MQFDLPLGWNAAQGKRVCNSATEKGRGIDFPGRYPQVTVEQLEYLWKVYTAKQKEPSWRRR